MTGNQNITNEKMEEIYERATEMIVDRIFDEKINTNEIQNQFEIITRDMIKEELNKISSSDTEPTIIEIDAIFKELKKIQREKLTSA